MAGKASQIGVAVLVVMLFFLGLGRSQDFPDRFPTLAGGTIGIEELVQGRWAVGFVVVPGCPACEKLIGWFSRAAQAFPEVRFLLVAPEATPELGALVQGQVLLDRGGVLGGWLEVKRAPTVVLFVEGVPVTRLDWPFTEGALLRALAESLLVEIKLPNPKELLGQAAPDFSAIDLTGMEVSLTELPRPLLLVFFSLGCAPCWEIFPMLAELSREVAVAPVATVGEAGLSAADRERLAQFLGEVEERGGSAVVLVDRWVKGEGYRILGAYKVGQSPTFVLIDGKGVIAKVWEGQVEAEKLAEEVRAALAEAG